MLPQAHGAGADASWPMPAPSISCTAVTKSKLLNLQLAKNGGADKNAPLPEPAHDLTRALSGVLKIAKRPMYSLLWILAERACCKLLFGSLMSASVEKFSSNIGIATCVIDLFR